MNETFWTRGARLTLLAVVLFIALNIAHVAYRFTLPSLGWAGVDPDNDELVRQFRLSSNAVGAPSPLQPGDVVKTIAGVPDQAILETTTYVNRRPACWQVGARVPVTVLRSGQLLEFDVPVVHWTLAAWWRVNIGRFAGFLEWFVTFLLFGAGLFTFLHRPGNYAARFLLTFGLANLSITLAFSIPDFLALGFNLPASFARVFFGNIIFAYLLGPSLLGFALTFPRPKAFIQRQPRWLLVPYLVGSSTILLLIVEPDLAVIGFLFTFAMLLLGVLALVHSAFTMRDAVSRLQLRWAVGGVAVGTGLFLLNFFSPFSSQYRAIVLAIASLGSPIIGVSLAIAILRHRLFDIDIIIRRTLQYALITGLLGLTYFGGVTLLQSLFTALSGQQSPAAVVLSTLAIAALFNPLRRRIQDFIDQRFYRKKYDAEKALAEFAAAARSEADLETLKAKLVSVVNETMQPQASSLWLKGKR